MTSQHLATAWYSHEFLRELVLIFPTYALMISATGVEPLQLTILMACWAGVVVLLEVPSGVLADLLPRRHLLVAGDLARASAFVIWLALPEFWGYLIGFLLLGTGSALQSGAAEALLYDSLQAKGRAADFARVFARGRAAASAGVGVALLAGGWAASSLGYPAVVLLSSLAPLTAAVLALVWLPRGQPPAFEPSENTSKPTFVQTLRDGISNLSQSPLLLRLTAILALLATIYGTMEEYVGPLLDTTGTSLTAIGLAYALCHGSRTLAMAVADQGSHWPLARQLLVFPLAGLLLLAAASPASPLVAAVIALMGYFALCALAEVWLLTRLQHGITGNQRATVTSTASLAIHLMGSLWFLASGAVAQQAGWPAAAAFLAGASILLGGLAWWLRPVPAATPIS